MLNSKYVNPKGNNMTNVFLKVKNKHLAEEAKIIRHEERKAKKQARYEVNKIRSTGANDYIRELNCYSTYQSLHNHRKWDVRNEQRATYLARAFLDGKKYSEVENCNKTDMYFLHCNIIHRVVKMVQKYGRFGNDVDTREMIVKWIEAK